MSQDKDNVRVGRFIDALDINGVYMRICVNTDRRRGNGEELVFVELDGSTGLLTVEAASALREMLQVAICDITNRKSTASAKAATAATKRGVKKE